MRISKLVSMGCFIAALLLGPAAHAAGTVGDIRANVHTTATVTTAAAACMNRIRELNPTITDLGVVTPNQKIWVAPHRYYTVRRVPQWRRTVSGICGMDAEIQVRQALMSANALQRIPTPAPTKGKGTARTSVVSGAAYAALWKKWNADETAIAALAADKAENARLAWVAGVFGTLFMLLFFYLVSKYENATGKINEFDAQRRLKDNPKPQSATNLGGLTTDERADYERVKGELCALQRQIESTPQPHSASQKEEDAEEEYQRLARDTRELRTTLRDVLRLANLEPITFTLAPEAIVETLPPEKRTFSAPMNGSALGRDGEPNFFWWTPWTDPTKRVRSLYDPVDFVKTFKGLDGEKFFKEHGITLKPRKQGGKFFTAPVLDPEKIFRKAQALVRQQIIDIPLAAAS